MALLLKLRDELKAGNLSVRYSKRFARLEEFFIDDRRWRGMLEDFFRRSGLPSDNKQDRNISRAVSAKPQQGRGFSSPYEPPIKSYLRN